MSAMIEGMLYEVLKVFARLLAPDSLLLEDGRHDEDDVLASSTSSEARAGDIVLTSTPGSFFLLWRMLTRQRYDHVVRLLVYVSMCG
tara:strand:- start:209 stop:469 length:261 start_codon:yes stop_codon:yes gene_type:complete